MNNLTLYVTDKLFVLVFEIDYIGIDMNKCFASSNEFYILLVTAAAHITINNNKNWENSHLWALHAGPLPTKPKCLSNHITYMVQTTAI